MYAYYLAVVFALIAAAYFFTTGDVYGTMGVTAWYLYYVGMIAAEEDFFEISKRVTG
jgi:hypothetical protein